MGRPLKRRGPRRSLLAGTIDLTRPMNTGTVLTDAVVITGTKQGAAEAPLG